MHIKQVKWKLTLDSEKITGVLSEKWRISRKKQGMLQI
jgi:hypothetical protein